MNFIHAQRDFHASPPDAPQHPANTRLGGRDSPRSPQQGRRRPHGAFRCDCFISSGSDSNASSSRPDRVRLLELTAMQILKPNMLPLFVQHRTRARFGASRKAALETCCASHVVCVTLPVCDRDMGPGPDQHLNVPSGVRRNPGRRWLAHDQGDWSGTEHNNSI
jgi:hypothetical protein